MFTILKTSRKQWELRFRLLKSIRIPYRWGGKVRPLSADWWTALQKGLDCSGFVQWVFWKAFGETIPEGSLSQWEWCDKRGFKAYGRAGYVANCLWKDHRVRVAFIAPVYRNGELAEAGHVWVIYDGQTYECYGGHGFGSRHPLTPALLRRVKECYVITGCLS